MATTWLLPQLPSWLGLVVGGKLWHLAPPGQPKPSDPSCGGGMDSNPDRARGAAEGVLHCVQRPGEVLVLPADYWRASCNLARYTLGFGGKGVVPGLTPWEGAAEAENRTLLEVENRSERWSAPLVPTADGAKGGQHCSASTAAAEAIAHQTEAAIAVASRSTTSTTWGSSNHTERQGMPRSPRRMLRPPGSTSSAASLLHVTS